MLLKAKYLLDTDSFIYFLHKSDTTKKTKLILFNQHSDILKHARHDHI